VAEAAATLLTIGQQVLQQQQGGEQPTVCFAAVPLLVPAAVIFGRALTRRMRRVEA
jgi:hypothetical protein